MPKAAIVFLLIVFCLVTPAYAQQQQAQSDTLTITTYYPAPYGEYVQVRLTPQTNFISQACTNKGAMQYDETTNQPYYCDGAIWKPMGGGSGGLVDVIRKINTVDEQIGTGGGGDTGWMNLTSCTTYVPPNSTLYVSFTGSVFRGHTVQNNYFRFTLNGLPLPAGGETFNWGGTGAGPTFDTINISRIIKTPSTGSRHLLRVQWRAYPDWAQIKANQAILNVLVFQNSGPWPSGLTD